MDIPLLILVAVFAFLFYGPPSKSGAKKEDKKGGDKKGGDKKGGDKK